MWFLHRCKLQNNHRERKWINHWISFRLLFTLNLDANVNGQVLYVSNLTINEVTRNVVCMYPQRYPHVISFSHLLPFLFALLLDMWTSNNINNSPSGIWAFDADQGGNALWHTSLPNQAEYTTNTPVIDITTNIMYFVSKVMPVLLKAASSLFPLPRRETTQAQTTCTLSTS
mgnify:CR=1 FL=1